MSTLYQQTQLLLGGSGLVIPFGRVKGFWLSIANDPVQNQASGTVVSVHVSGPRVDTTFLVGYGSPTVTRYFDGGNLLQISGSGAYIEVLASTDGAAIAPQTIPISVVQANVTNRVGVDVQLNTIGLAKDSTLTGGGISQLPPSLISGAHLDVSIQDPPQYTTSGSKKVVPVHDLGA